jgi:ParB/RepB/Spo0J family partition protein
MSKMVAISDLRPHPRLGTTELLPALTDEEYAGLRDSIRSAGIMQPLVVAWPEKVVIDGHHRLRIAIELGIAEVPVMVEEFMNEDARLRLGVELNAARRQMSGEQKREAIAVLLKADPERSDNVLAKVVGASGMTVAAVREGLESTSQIVKSDTRVGADGKRRPAKRTNGHKNGTPAPKKDGPKKRANVPDLGGRLFSEVVREGMEFLGDADEAAKAVGISPRAFRRARYALSMVGDDRLTSQQSEAIASAVAMSDEAGTMTDTAWALVEPIVEARYGPISQRRGARGSIEAAADAHTEGFMRAYTTVIHACMATPDIRVPLLHREDRERIKSEITTAIEKLKQLRRRVGTRGGS